MLPLSPFAKKWPLNLDQNDLEPMVNWKCGLGLSVVVAASVGSVPRSNASPTCSTDFEPFMGEMLKALPAYINRVNTRVNNGHSSVLLAARADYQSLELPPASSSVGSELSEDKVKQVFFSTLLRRFSDRQAIYQQEHHWLFMAPSDRGWEFVQMYSILSPYPVASLTTAPRNSSEGSVATAIRDWLKNCHYQTTR